MLLAAQRLKMACSVHAFVRGATVQFYQWLAQPGMEMIPKGPPIWICGDCHVGNLGPVADAHGRVEVQIRDLDQAVIGNPAHDLIRLSLSLATAIRSSDLPGVTTARMLEAIIAGYRRAFASHRRDQSGAWPASVRLVMRRAMNRTWRLLANERIGGVTPDIPHGKSFWPLSRPERAAIHRLFTRPDVRRLVTCLSSRSDDSTVTVVDAAYWRKGCSSLGRLRFAVLVRIGNRRQKGDGLCLIDIKEAVRTAAPKAARVAMQRDNAERVVAGAKHLAPFLGSRMLATRLLRRSVFLRELRPQDLKVEIDHVTQAEALKAATFLAHVVGKAHARQMDAQTRAAWRKTLMRSHRGSVSAPSWLWSSVVRQLVHHEEAYLEHCRQYAMQELR